MENSQKKPVIIVVHALWHSPPSYVKLSTLLQQAGYEVYVPFLPSCTGARPPVAGLPEDIQLVRRLVEILADQGNSIVMVMHCYGGLVGNSALEGLDTGSRSKQGKKGGVAQLVGVSAHIHPLNFGGLDLVREFHNEDLLPLAITTAEDGACISADPRTLLFTGLSEHETDSIMSTLTRAPIACLESGATFDAWKHIPLTYIHNTQDACLPLHYQQRIVEKVEKSGVNVKVLTIDTGHSPYATHPFEVATIVQDVASRVA